MGVQARNYSVLRKQIEEALRDGVVEPTWSAIGRHFKVPPTTLQTAAPREWGISKPMELLGAPNTKNERLGLKDQEDGNIREITNTTTRIVTLEELLEYCKVNLDEWDVKDYLVNKWEYGVGDGTIYPLYQVKAWLVKKKLEAIMPIIQPVEITIQKATPKKKAKSKKDKIQRALIIPDVHTGFRRRLHTHELLPFHDRRVLDLAMQVLEFQNFDRVLFIGDVLDLAEWSSKFTPEPEFYFTTQPALIELAWWLAEVRKTAQNAVIEIYEGNHDKRLMDLVAGYMKAAYGLRPVDELELPPSMSVERLLALHTLDVNYVGGYPDNRQWLNENVAIEHGNVVRAGPGDSAKAIVNKTTFTTIFGHIHRRELVTRRIQSRDGDVIQHAFCPGTACHIDGRVPGSKKDDQWQQGFAVIEFTDTFETIIPIPVNEGRAIYRGELFQARARDKMIDKMIFENLQTIGEE